MFLSLYSVHVLGSFPSFSGSGFISLNDLLGPGEAIQMEIIFKPQRSSGIILYNHLQGNFLGKDIQSNKHSQICKV